VKQSERHKDEPALERVDRWHQRLDVGHKVRVRHCVGRYGQTQDVEGILRELDAHGGLTIELTVPAIGRREGRRFPLGVGDQMYIPFNPQVQDRQLVYEHQHIDVEHGHLAWVELIDTRRVADLHPMKIACVMMQDLVGNYELPSDVPEWQWVVERASFRHNDNGSHGVFEHVLNLGLDLEDIPSRLVPTIDVARNLGVAYLVFHQGT
jgi:hypothetical protein